MHTAALFDELEKIALAGSRGGKVHHYSIKGEPVYQSEIDRRNEKKSKWSTPIGVAAGVAGAAALGMAARKFHANLAAKRVASRMADNHNTWTASKKSYEGIYNIGQQYYHEADHAAGKAAFDKHFEDARKAHDSVHQANNWKKWNSWDARTKSSNASEEAFRHARGVRDDLHAARRARDKEARPRWYEEAWGRWSGFSGRGGAGARRSGSSRDAGARTTNYSVGHIAKLEDAGLTDLGRVKTKAEAKKIYRSFVIEHHPDKVQAGTSVKELEERTERLKKVNALWDEFKHSNEFNKLAAVLLAFRRHSY